MPSNLLLVTAVELDFLYQRYRGVGWKWEHFSPLWDSGYMEKHLDVFFFK